MEKGFRDQIPWENPKSKERRQTSLLNVGLVRAFNGPLCIGNPHQGNVVCSISQAFFPTGPLSVEELDSASLTILSLCMMSSDPIASEYFYLKIWFLAWVSPLGSKHQSPFIYNCQIDNSNLKCSKCTCSPPIFISIIGSGNAVDQLRGSKTEDLLDSPLPLVPFIKCINTSVVSNYKLHSARDHFSPTATSDEPN